MVARETWITLNVASKTDRQWSQNGPTTAHLWTTVQPLKISPMWCNRSWNVLGFMLCLSYAYVMLLDQHWLNRKKVDSITKKIDRSWAITWWAFFYPPRLADATREKRLCPIQSGGMKESGGSDEPYQNIIWAQWTKLDSAEPMSESNSDATDKERAGNTIALKSTKKRRQSRCRMLSDGMRRKDGCRWGEVKWWLVV